MISINFTSVLYLLDWYTVIVFPGPCIFVKVGYVMYFPPEVTRLACTFLGYQGS